MYSGRLFRPPLSKSWPNLVAMTTGSRTGASASPTSSSFANRPYTLAVGLEVEDTPGLDAAGQDVVEELRDVTAHRRNAAAQPDVAEDHGLDRYLDVVGHPDSANN